MDDVGLFFFLATGGVALFTFLSVAHWVETRAAERAARDRLALFRKLAETPAEAAGIVLAQLREDDARREQKERLEAIRARKDSRQSGLVVLAVGIGLSIFLNRVVPDKPVWTVGIIPLLIGLVIFASSFFQKPDDPDRAP